MANKPRKKSGAQHAAPEPPPPMPRIGDKVTIPRTKSVLEVTHVSRDGDEVNLQLAGTNLEWFRVRTDTLTFVERKPPARTSNPFTNPAPAFDTDEILERITTVQEENLETARRRCRNLEGLPEVAPRAQNSDRGARSLDRRAARELEEGRDPDQKAAGGVNFSLSQMVDCFAMPQGAATLLIEKLETVAIDIEAIERLIASEPPNTSDQLLALRTIQGLYRRLADDLRIGISLFE
jgi:hypothetical protein